MPIIVKTDGAQVTVEREKLLLRTQGQIVSPVSGFIKHSGVWSPIWVDESSGGGSNSPLPAGVPRWGIAQFSDTDFTGGKTNPNQDGKPYDRWSGPQEFIDSMLQTYDPSLLVDLNIEFPLYGYFAMKASDGNAEFVDTINGWPGGWDGAEWEDGGFGFSSGPLIVQYDDGSGLADWKVYRTDFSGIGQLSWNVSIS